MTVYKKREMEKFASRSLNIDENRLLIFQLVEHYSLTIIMINALDKCDSKKRTNLLKILELILQKSSSLMKIFVSNQNDQDIVLRLLDYPNFELSSKMNKDNISLFFIAEIDNFIKKKKLLALNTNKENLKLKIIKQITKKADEMSVLCSNASHVYVPLM